MENKDGEVIIATCAHMVEYSEAESTGIESIVAGAAGTDESAGVSIGAASQQRLNPRFKVFFF